MKKKLSQTAVLLLFATILMQPLAAGAQGTAFTYNGRLDDGGSPASGIYDLRFAIYDALTGGTQQGVLVTNAATAVSNGLFTVTLDFGAGIFNGASRWLELGVRTNGGGAFGLLTPRQAVTPTPYAIYSASAASAGTAASATTATTANNFSGALAGDVTGTQGATVVATIGGQTATNVASGATAANAATNVNMPGTLVTRDGSGNFSAGTITATLAGNAATATTATNVTGNLADTQLSTNITRLNGTNTFIGTNNFSGVVLATNGNNILSGMFTGNGAGLTNLPATSLAGILPLAQLPVLVLTNNETGVALSGTFTGNGFSLTNLNPANLSAGTAGINISGNAATASSATNFSGSLAGDVTGTQGSTVVSANLPRLNGTNIFTGTNTFAGVVLATNQGNVLIGTFTGNGGGLTGLNAAQLTGTISAGNIGAGSITSTMLAAGSVTSNQLAAAAVTTSALADGAVTALKLATTNVTDWHLSTTITNPTPAANDQFGNVVAALGGDRVLVGAMLDSAGAPNAGAAYLFSVNGTLLTTITNPTPADSAYFGSGVAAVGTDRVLIGAAGDNTGATSAGAAYLFSTNGTLLTTFTNPTPADYDAFGYAVAALGGDRLLIGAYGDNTGALKAGAAYLFSTNGTLLTTFTNPTPEASDFFGYTVAAMGNDRVLIGASGDDTGATYAGAAYLFSTNGTLLTTFTNPTPADSDFFGCAVAAAGSDRVLVGAYGDSTGATNTGAAYLFSTNGTLLTTFTNPVPAAFDAFGYAVAAVGSDRVLVGAYGDSTGATNTGAAYLFSTGAPFLTAFANPTPATSAYFGSAVAAVGNNRVLIGAFEESTGVPHAGAAFVFALAPPFTPGLVAEGVRSGSSTTASLADGAVTAEKIGGVLLATQIPNLDASKITSGTLADAQLSANIARLNGNNTFAGTNNFSGVVLATNVNNVLSGTFTGDGGGLTVLNANNLSSGTVPLTQLSGITSTQLNATTWLLATNLNGGNAALATNVVAGISITNAFITNSVFAGDGGGLTNLNASQLASGTVPLAQLPGVVVTNNQSGLTLSGTFFGDGGGLGNLSAYQLSGGTLSDSLLSPNVALLGANQTFLGQNLFNANVGIGNANPTNKLMVVNARCDGSSWINASDRNLKQGFAGVDAQAVLARVVALSVQTWSYKAQPEQKHLGPVAQDFHSAFGLGADDVSIATVDESGVALAAIQGLNQKLNAKDAEIRQLQQSVAELKKLVQSLAEKEKERRTAGGPAPARGK